MYQAHFLFFNSPATESEYGAKPRGNVEVTKYIAKIVKLSLEMSLSVFAAENDTIRFDRPMFVRLFFLGVLRRGGGGLQACSL